MPQRDKTLARLRENPQISVLIIGAGINGVGTYRDLAAQGVDVLIIDKDDFCSGASAASSHMLHGGIRYLENGEFRLVREALTERNLMLRNAPHYAKPLPTTVPIFRYFSGLFNAPLKFLGVMDKPAERGALVIKAGMIMYDLFAAKYRVMPTHTFQGRDKSLRKYPRLNPEVRFTGTYYDSWMPSPERIVMDLLRDTDDLGAEAHALNYVSAVDADGDRVTLRDEISGETFEVQPRVVINAGGPWIDFVNKHMGEETRFIGGTKGCHVILDHPALYDALNGHEFFFENKDGRILLLLPYLGKVMAGTTDIRIDNPDQITIDADEIDYILGAIPHVFPNLDVTREHIVFQFTGVRPLPHSGAGYTGNVSRDHQIRSVAPAQSGLDFPIHALVGGKWTTFRAFAEQTADKVLQDLGQTRQRSTQDMPIGGGKDYPTDEAAQRAWIDDLAQETDISPARARTLFERYGTHAQTIARFCADGDDAPLAHHPAYTRREILYLIHSEGVTRVVDIPLRRTLIAWLGETTQPLLEELADICAEALGWDAATRAREIEHANTLLRTHFGARLPAPAATG
ncbi:MAG: glycerol-3-phosphate dehydrogenase/oxidase [Anaerolineales bacterium]